MNISDILKKMNQPNRKNVSLDQLALEWFRQTGLAIFNNTIHKLSDWNGVQWKKDILTISPSSKNNFSYNGGSITINIKSNTNWKALEVSNITATSLSPISGSSNGTIKLNVTRNPSNVNPRNGSIKIVAGSVTKYFYWSQLASGTGGSGPVELPFK